MNCSRRNRSCPEVRARRFAQIQNEREDAFDLSGIAVENRNFGVCEIATLAFPSTGISGEILQIGQTWLQCRQQAERVCQVLQEKKGAQVAKPRTFPRFLLG